ncbi:MAG TPA: WD40 repeat domain-containing protein [Pilimelia sp.]|nr:WD40 repeat domain-containing protein [Pilimelia sp.]
MSGPDATLLASAGADGTVRLWDPATGGPVGDPLIGHTGVVQAVAAVPGPDGRALLASAGEDGAVRLWDPGTGGPVGDPLIGHTGGVWAVAAVPGPEERTWLASAGGDGTVRLWDPATGSPVGDPLKVAPAQAYSRQQGPVDVTVDAAASLTGHTGSVSAVAAVPGPDGRTLLASAGTDGAVRLWDPASGSPVGDPLTGHTGWVRVVTAVPVPDGRALLASAGDDGTVRLWDPATGSPVRGPLTTGAVHCRRDSFGRYRCRLNGVRTLPRAPW